MVNPVQVVKNENREKIKGDWSKFFLLISNPFVLLLSIAIYFLFVFQQSQKDSATILILTVVITFVSGIWGGVLSKKWDDYTDTKVIETRGQSANRNLQLLLNRVIALEKRVSQYLNRFNDDGSAKEINNMVLRTYFEEIINSCVGIEENILSSIQDWTDIIPEADIQEKINSIINLKDKVITQEILLEKYSKEMESNKKSSSQEIENLKAKINSLIKQISDDRRRLVVETTASGINNLSSSLITGGTVQVNPSFDYDFFPGVNIPSRSGITLPNYINKNGILFENKNDQGEISTEKKIPKKKK